MTFDLIDSIKRIKPQYKVTFLSAVIFGILSQGMGLFNKYSYADEVGGGFTSLGATSTSGRWMLEVLSRIELFIFGDGHFSLPVFNGFFSILLIAITACLFVSLLEVNNKTLCVSIGAIMVVFPTVTGLFGFMFCAPSYMLSMLLGVYGAYLVCKNDNWIKIAAGIILMGCSVGIYQAFIPVILSTFVFYLIKFTLNENNDFKKIIKKIGISIVSIILFMIFYFVVNKIVLSLNNLELTTYQGIDQMGKASIGDYLYRIAYAYGRFFILNENSQYYMYYGNIKYIYYLIIIIGIALILAVTINQFKKDKLKGIVLALLFLSIPLASNFIFVMVDADYVHALMVYGQVMPLILFAYVLDTICADTSIIKYTSIIGTASLLLISVMFVRFDNQCYLKAEFSQQEAISYFTTLVTRIKSVENYDDELPVSFVFIDGSHIEDTSMYSIENLDYIHLIQYDDLYLYINNYEWKSFMKKWCGYGSQIVDGSDLTTNQEVLNMTCYPDYGSIKVIDNRVVVRFQ